MKTYMHFCQHQEFNSQNSLNIYGKGKCLKLKL
jgi:hypothetical protein